MSGCYRTAVLLLALLVGQGCATRGNVDLLEGRLRQQEDSLSQMQSQLTHAQKELVATRKEADELRTQIAARGEKTLLPEQADVLYRAAGIEIDRLRTGGLDSDGKPGDEVLTAAIVPHDSDGELLKVAGSVELELLDLTKPETQQRVGKWSFNSDESREHWHRNFLGSGYVFKVPLKQPPDSSQLVLHATLVAPDGRRFNASETIRMNPAGAADAGALASKDARTQPHNGAPQTDVPNPIRATGGEKLIAPQLGTPSSSASSRSPLLDGGRAASSAFGATSPSTSRVDAARPAPQRISYEREGNGLFDLSPPDNGASKARSGVAPVGDAKRMSALSQDPFGGSAYDTNRKPTPPASEPNNRAALPFDNDLRPNVGPPALDEFGLPKNWQGGSGGAATSTKPLPDWAR